MDFVLIHRLATEDLEANKNTTAGFVVFGVIPLLLEHFLSFNDNCLTTSHLAALFTK
jgi:hypothetical protein